MRQTPRTSATHKRRGWCLTSRRDLRFECDLKVSALDTEARVLCCCLANEHAASVRGAGSLQPVSPAASSGIHHFSPSVSRRGKTVIFLSRLCIATWIPQHCLHAGKSWQLLSLGAAETSWKSRLSDLFQRQRFWGWGLLLYLLLENESLGSEGGGPALENQGVCRLRIIAGLHQNWSSYSLEILIYFYIVVGAKWTSLVFQPVKIFENVQVLKHWETVVNI